MKIKNESDNKRNNKPKEEISVYFRYSHLGLVFLIVIFMFLGIGYLLDELFGTYPWLFAISVFPGFAAGFYLLYKELIIPTDTKSSKKSDKT